MRLQDKKVAILVEDLYEDLEFWYPYYRMREEGAMVVSIGAGKGSYASKRGLPVTPDTSVANVKADDFDAVIIPGGYAPDHMRRTPAMVAFVRAMFDQGKVVAAICHAGWMLASAKILQGKRVTGFFAIKDDLVHAGAEYVDQEVVQDGHLITSRAPGDLPAFCRTIIHALR